MKKLITHTAFFKETVDEESISAMAPDGPFEQAHKLRLIIMKLFDGRALAHFSRDIAAHVKSFIASIR